MGKEKGFLSRFFGRRPTKKELAGHYADRVSALERQKKALRRQGEIGLCLEVNKKIGEIQQEAEAEGFSKRRYPGLYR